MNPVSLANSIIQRITSIAPPLPINLPPLVSSHSEEPARVSFPTTSHIIVPSLSAILPPSREPIILYKCEVTKNVNPFITANSLAFASATGILASNIFGDYGVGNQVEVERQSISDDYWSVFYSLSGVCARTENNKVVSQLEWDSHGLTNNITVQLNELVSDKKYMVYDNILFDEKNGEILNNDDQIVVNIRPGGIYTVADLQNKLERLRYSSLFERVEFELKTNFDGTISIKILFQFQEFSFDFLNFRCISVGLLPKLIENHTELEYKRRIERSKPCMLPYSVQSEILNMLKKHGKVRVKQLYKIQHRVNKWYKDNGYDGAGVVRFGNLGTKELVCEVMEGDITRMEFLFQDKSENVIDGDTKLPLIKKYLPKQFREGQIYKMEHAQQAVDNLNSSYLYSQIIMKTRKDDDKEGIIVQFVLTEDNFTQDEQKGMPISLKMKKSGKKLEFP